MAVILGIPVMILVVIFQTSVFRSLVLIHGTADLVLLVIIAVAIRRRGTASLAWALMAGLMVGFISGVPWFVFPLAYLGAAALARFLSSQVWQTPILAMFLTTLLGTVISEGFQWVALRVQGVPLPMMESINLVLLPGLLLNLLLALPVYALVTDLTRSVSLEEVA
jgi:cell shape-determining protein MreD|uniref:Rod shape-determining protein MreD n=1 Tax=Anaerolinea thermolimosa TaxID=229919 RepID=A0A7C4PIM1_9CHLR